jgi:hypothetical protein
MTPPDIQGVMYRVEQLERRQAREEERVDVAETVIAKHDLELHGERGVNATLRDLTLQMRNLQRALWGLASAITVAALVFAAGTVGH